MAEVTPSGRGGATAPTMPGEDGSLAIRGGVGGISFQLEELIGGAEKLDELADELSAVEVEARRIWEDLCPYQDDARSTGTEALISVGEAQRSVQAVRMELQRISRDVRASKRDYELAEVASALARGLGLTGLGVLARQLLDVPLGPSLNRESTEALAGDVPWTIALLLGFPGYVVTAAAADHAARTHTSAAFPLIRSAAESAPRLLEPRPVMVKKEESLPIELDASPAGLLERVSAIDERGDGYIEVIEVHNSGRKTYIVVVPGTQSGAGIGGDNPFDVAGIVEGLGYGSAEVNAAVLGALQAAGAEKGATVVGVGYSQGGIHAMNLAADDLFMAEYDVKYVLTAGSPVGAIDPAAGISTLHLEHRQDWVPGSDGESSPDSGRRVTVTLNNEVRTPEGEDPGLGPGHRLLNYQEGARRVASSDDPSLVASNAVLGGLLGAGGTATATRFSLSRQKLPELQAAHQLTPTPAPQPSPQPPPGDRQAPSRKAGR